MTRCGNIDLIYKNEILEISEMIFEISTSLKYNHLEISDKNYVQKLLFVSKSTIPHRFPSTKFAFGHSSSILVSTCAFVCISKF